MTGCVLYVCVVAILVAQIVLPAAAVILTKCDAAKQLYNNGITKSELPNWLCLIQRESNYNTAAIHINTVDGSKDNGIFQISDLYWCGERTAGGECNILCSKLLDDDITDDIECAKLIFDVHEYKAWYGWVDHCQNVKLPSISDCSL